MIPYGLQTIEEDDIRSVVKSLDTTFLTTGPDVAAFEQKFAAKVKTRFAVAVSSGTAALHCACIAAGLRRGNELITTPMTFAASANCALYCNATPIFADVNENGLISTQAIEAKITPHTRIIVPVHYAGFYCNMKEIAHIAKKHRLIVVEDACHALGGSYLGEPIGSCAYSDMACFSFHPVKHITTGEGGMVTTNSPDLYKLLKMARNHGITKDYEKMTCADGPWYYEQKILGYNYRITDFQCRLGSSQLSKLDRFVHVRRKIAKRYDAAFAQIPSIKVLKGNADTSSSYHLYVIKVQDSRTRKNLFMHLQRRKIFCQVHYIPVYWHPYYQSLGYERGLCPHAEQFYERIISLPIFPLLTQKNQETVIQAVQEYFVGNISTEEKI